MTRANLLGPLDPIFDVETSYGAIAAGNSPGTSGVFCNINQASTQVDPTALQTIYFTAVFAEAVTGFDVGGDVNISGTANASIADIVNSGDDITYTVGISGMTQPGTVTVTIPAAVCTAISDGTPNRASSSTDNTVTFQAPQLIHIIDLVDVAIDGICGLWAQGDFLYGCCNPIDKFVIIDISDREAPFIRSSLTGGNFDRCSAVCAVGDYVFVSCGNINQFTTVDVSNPDAPVVTDVLSDSLLSVTHSMQPIETNTRYIAVPALNDSRVNIIDTNNKTAAAIVEAVSLTFPNMTATHGSMMAATEELATDAVRLYDASDPLNVIQTDSVSVTPSSLNGIDFNDDWLLVGGRTSPWGMAVIDVADPANISQVLFISGASGAFAPTRIIVEGIFAFTINALLMRAYQLNNLPGALTLADSEVLPYNVDGVDDLLTPGGFTYHTDGYLYCSSPASNAVMVYAIQVM